MKKRWIYVCAFSYETNNYDPSMPGFRHTVVEGQHEEDAYDHGYAALALEKGERRINDYVIDLEEVNRGE